MELTWLVILELGIIILVMSAFCVGLKFSLDQGNFLYPVYQYLEDRIGRFWIYNPLIGCVYCFSTIWGSLIFWSIHLLYPIEITMFTLIKWPVAWIACAGLNQVLYDILKRKIFFLGERK